MTYFKQGFLFYCLSTQFMFNTCVKNMQLHTYIKICVLLHAVEQNNDQVASARGNNVALCPRFQREKRALFLSHPCFQVSSFEKATLARSRVRTANLYEHRAPLNKYFSNVTTSCIVRVNS